MNKERIIERINELKTDVQYIIDSAKSKTTDSSKLQKIKKEKLLLLKQLTDDLKRIHKIEQKSQSLVNNIKKVHNENDSINFQSDKNKKNNTLNISKAKLQKQIRKESMYIYLEFLEEQKFYNIFENDKIPSCIFLHESVLSSYGFCPFIKIKELVDLNPKSKIEDSQIENYKQLIYNKRKQWLDSTNDNGKIYWDLYDKIFNKKDLLNHYKQLHDLDKQIQNFIQSSFSDNQKQMYVTCIDIIKEYTSLNIKNKTIKEKFKSVINNLSILVSQLGYNLHHFLNIKYNLNIVVNFLPNSINNIFLETEFEKLLDCYTLINEQILHKEKYITNSKNNLNNEMYLFLTNQKKFDAHVNNLPNLFIQSKKYFKRWALLTETEKLERYESYANYYIDKYLISSNIIPINERDSKLAFLIDLLHQAHKDKDLIFRDLKWSNKDGIIEQIKCLKFNKDTHEFYLTPSKKAGKIISKKKVSVKTIFSKQTEKFINEEILCHIVLFFQKHSENINQKELQKQNKESCIELIKNKLKIKKLTNDDKKIIFQKYDEMFNVVKNNQ